jgi:Ricin-type beta-trefoil lectin domain-like
MSSMSGLLRRVVLTGAIAAFALPIALPAAAFGVASPDAEHCDRLVRSAVLGACSVGPTAIPAADVGRQPVPLRADVAAAVIEANPVVCDGDGVSGKRVEVLYVRQQSTASRFARFEASFQAFSHEIDAAYNDSAAQTGASRHIRWVTEPDGAGCRVKVTEVVVPDGSLANWESGVKALQDKGFTNASRKYLFYADAQVICGQGTLYDDDRPGLDNPNNTTVGYARVDASPNCWGFNAAAHELGHNLGAVQLSAPNADGGFHCRDEYDLMCYGDTTVVCAEKDTDRLMDCNHDDYFHTSPPAGSYLASHWNVANSDWLIKGSTPDPSGSPKSGESYVITNAATGNAVDVIDGSAADLVRLSHRAPSGATSQQWRFQYETGWQLANVNSSKCADSAFSGTEPGTEILQYGCNGQDGMRWALYPLGEGKFGIVNFLTGLAVTDSGAYPTPLKQQPFTGDATQQWELTRVP